MTRLLPIVLLVIATSSPAPVAADPGEPSAADVAGAPAAGEESGRVDDRVERDSVARRIARGVLAVPRYALELTFAPVRAGIWAYERYQLEERYYQLFFNEARTVGLYPTASLHSGYGVTAGARFVHRDLFGAREHLGLHAATGGRYRELVTTDLSSGRRLGRLELGIAGSLERHPGDKFYGIGDDSTGMDARFRQQIERVRMSADLRVIDGLHVRASGAVADLEFGLADNEPSILELYPDDTMVGFDGVRQAYGELELRWDSRRRATAWEAPSVHATGWLLAGFGGRVAALDDGADYWRYGFDAQRFLRLGSGPRVIAARLYGEAVTGTHAQVPFTVLPRLGGKTLLRGYPLDRFRDRVAAMGSLEYSWDLSRMVSASLFVDAGRVFPSVDAIELTGLRVGYGLGFELHTDRSFLLRTSIATSRDGGVFLDLAFDPVFDLEPRVERD